jgi:serine/threonine protein kinase
MGKNKQIQPKALVKRSYTVTERIGHGGFGVILTARSARHHSRMAIKVIERRSNGVPDDVLQEPIDNENKFADKFDHLYINVYHEIFEKSKK